MTDVLFRKSSPQEIEHAEEIVASVRQQIGHLIQEGKKVHIIWDFDAVLVSPRSDDVFRITGGDLKTYFEYEERLLLQTPEYGLWYYPLAHKCGSLHTSQDIVTARSSFLAFRVFLVSLFIPVRWQLFLGHQPKVGAYRMILNSFKEQPDYCFFFIDDNEKHVEDFNAVSNEMGLCERSFGIVAPVVREYDAQELKVHLSRILRAQGGKSLHVRDDPNHDVNGMTVLPGGCEQFKKLLEELKLNAYSDGINDELR